MIVPKWMARNAAMGLAWVAAGHSGHGLQFSSIREARDMARGVVTREKCARMVGWFARHSIDLEAPAAKIGHPNYPSPGVVAHALWGGGSKIQSIHAQQWAAQQVNGGKPQPIGLLSRPIPTRARVWSGM